MSNQEAFFQIWLPVIKLPKVWSRLIKSVCARFSFLSLPGVRLPLWLYLKGPPHFRHRGEQAAQILFKEEHTIYFREDGPSRLRTRPSWNTRVWWLSVGLATNDCHYWFKVLLCWRTCDLAPSFLDCGFGAPHRVLSLNMAVSKTLGAAKFIMKGNKYELFLALFTRVVSLSFTEAWLLNRQQVHFVVHFALHAITSHEVSKHCLRFNMSCILFTALDFLLLVLETCMVVFQAPRPLEAHNILQLQH